jgi:hypothetical protein
MKSKTTLSTGVELGAWAFPAGNSLPPLNLSVEEIAEILHKNRDAIERLIESIECPSPLHRPFRRGTTE